MIDKLIQELDDTNNEVRANAKEHLIQIGADAVEPLIVALRSGSLRQSWQAAVVLGLIPDSRWLEEMQGALSSSNILLGQAAVIALENALHSGAVDHFLEVLPHSKLVVQIALISSLERLQDIRAVEPLSRLLVTTESPELRYSIIQALGQIGDQSVIPLIEQFQDDPNTHVRDRVAIALLRLGTQ